METSYTFTQKELEDNIKGFSMILMLKLMCIKEEDRNITSINEAMSSAAKIIFKIDISDKKDKTTL